jgi:hypothetical protein
LRRSIVLRSGTVAWRRLGSGDHERTTVSATKPETLLNAHAPPATHPIDVLVRTKAEPPTGAIVVAFREEHDCD